MISEYRHTRRVQFYETDTAGIVHFSWFFRYIEEAEHAMWRLAGLSIYRPDSDVHWPRVSASCEFRQPLRFEDEFEVWLQVADIAERRMRYECVLSRGESTVATGSMTIACATKNQAGGMRSAPIPPEVARAFRVFTRADA